jgi:hypothetical protein
MNNCYLSIFLSGVKMNKFVILMGFFGALNAAIAGDTVQLRTGVILDPSSKSLMVMLPAGGIAAVDLTTGNTKWSSSEADKPLMISNGQILSQQKVNKKGLLNLVYQSVETGVVQNTVSLTLPRDVMANVVNGTGNDFQIGKNPSAQTSQLQWQFRGNKIRGAAPDSVTNSQPAGNSNLLTQNIKQGLINLDFSNRQAAIANVTEAFNSPKAAIEKRVLPQVEGRQFLSQNGQHVLASVRTDDNKAITYAWNIYALNGDLLSSFNASHSYLPFVVEGNLMLMIEPETGRIEAGKLVKNSPLLKAINLTTQSPVWQYAVRSTKYFGQLPL